MCGEKIVAEADPHHFEILLTHSFQRIAFFKEGILPRNKKNPSNDENGVQVAAVVESLQRDMLLICVTGVEDRLQDGVRQTLEMLR